MQRLAEAGTLDSVRSALDTGDTQLIENLPAVLSERFTDSEREALLGAGQPTSSLVTPLLARDRALGAMVLVNAESGRNFDAADLELAEELGRRAAIALDNARLYRDAQEANRAKSDFLAVMSHELRTPLNAIMGYTDLMDAEVSGPLSPTQHNQIGRIRTSARHLLQLIEEILSYARMESGGEEVRVARNDGGSLAEAAAAIVEPLAQARGLRFEVDVRDGHVAIVTDGAKVRQVLVNLLSNAVKFTDQGVVSLRFRRDGDHVIYEVEDTGIGIPEDQHRRIFDPFWQVERPNTRRAGGTGLGLSVSRRYARLLHGDLTFESTPGKGSTFRLRLPLLYNEESAGADSR
jgi:signal transduction histidine kinase